MLGPGAKVAQVRAEEPAGGRISFVLCHAEVESPRLRLPMSSTTLRFQTRNGATRTTVEIDGTGLGRHNVCEALPSLTALSRAMRLEPPAQA